MISPTRHLILDRNSIERKLKRMAFQIWEAHSNSKHLSIVGIAEAGIVLAKELAVLVHEISGMQVNVHALRMDKRNPSKTRTTLEDSEQLSEALVLVDDVASSGRTLLYAMQALLQLRPTQLSLAVLVDRQQKSFPVATTIVGHTLATTLQDHIVVETVGDKVMAAYIE